MISIQNYVRAQSLEQAYALNQNRRNRILGGMLWTRLGNGTIGTAIDLCDLGLDTIEEAGDAFSVGAMVTLRQLEQHPDLNRYTQNAIRDAVKDIVGVQFRNLATVGGSVWGRFGFSDVLTVLMALDCAVELYQGGVVPLEEFATRKHDRDLLVRLIIRKTPVRCVYTAMRNQSTDFPVVTCAVSRLEGGYRAVIGARPARAIVVRDEKGLLSGENSPEKAAAFAKYVAAAVPTGSNLRGSAAYRTHLIEVLTKRSVAELEETSHGN